MANRRLFARIIGREKPKKTPSFRREPKSRFGLYMVMTAGIAIVGFAYAAKTGNQETQRNLERLCSPKGGLKFEAETEKDVTFSTTMNMKTVKELMEDVKWEALTGRAPGYVNDSKTSQDFNAGTLTFTKGPDGLSNGRFKVEGSTFSITRAVRMPEVFGKSPACAHNVNQKRIEARRVHEAGDLARKLGYLRQKKMD